MGETGIRVLSFKLLVLSLVMLGLIPCITKPVRAQTSTNTTVYLPSLEKTLETGEVNKYYSIGGVTIQRSSRGGQEKLYYLFPDHLSSTRLVVDKEVKEADYLSYYPYGNLKAISLPSSITNLYTGQKQDREINLYYYHARYYNPTVGHFISADSAQGPNRYAYVSNNPINNTDPTGNFCLFGLFGNCTSTWESMGIHQATSQQAAEAATGNPANTYAPSIVSGAIAEGISNLDIPIVSGMAGQYSLAAQQAIFGAETGDTQMQLDSAYNLAIVTGNVYFLGQMAEYSYQTGKATYNYYKPIKYGSYSTDGLNGLESKLVSGSGIEYADEKLPDQAITTCVGQECWSGKIKPEGVKQTFCGGPTQEGCSQVSSLISQRLRGSMDGDWTSTARGIEAWQNYTQRLNKVLEQVDCPYQCQIQKIIDDISH